MGSRRRWRTSRKDMDSFLSVTPPELTHGFVVYAYPPEGVERERVAFYGPDARERADEYADLQNRIDALESHAAAQLKERDAIIDEAMRLLEREQEGKYCLGCLRLLPKHNDDCPYQALRARIEEARK